jgi:multidrug transporter EmrE-like cation transporter
VLDGAGLSRNQCEVLCIALILAGVIGLKLVGR